MRVLGLSAFHRDSAAAVCVDGRIVAAAQEERFTRRRVDSNLPRRAARFCLDSAGLAAAELDAVVFYEKPLRKFERTLAVQLNAFPHSARSFSRGLFLWLGDRLWLRTRLAEEFAVAPEKVQFVEHARSHAAFAFHTSPYPRAAVLVVDDLGEWATTTLARGDGAQLETLAETHFPHSLGLWFSAWTQFLGFEPGLDEERVEALAHWGAPRMEHEVAATVPSLERGSFEVDLRRFRFAYDPEKLCDESLVELFGPARPSGSPLRLSGGDTRDADLAASVQRVLEERVLALARELHSRSGCEVACLGGEVLRNRTLLTRLAHDGPFRELFAPLALGEAGAAAGAALEYSARHGAPRCAMSLHAGWGERVDVRAEDGAVSLGSIEAARTKLAELLRAQRTVAWVRGALELGPESLGARVILGSASGFDARERLLGALQRAESYLPVRVLARAQDAELWFELPAAARRLARTGACMAKQTERFRDCAPSAALPDGAVWVQLVERDDDPQLHALLGDLALDGQPPLALCASFHLRGQPIVRTEADAVEAFRRSTLDALVVEDRLYEPVST